MGPYVSVVVVVVDYTAAVLMYVLQLFQTRWSAALVLLFFPIWLQMQRFGSIFILFLFFWNIVAHRIKMWTMGETSSHFHVFVGGPEKKKERE